MNNSEKQTCNMGTRYRTKTNNTKN